MIHIHLSFPNPLTHLVHVEIQMSSQGLNALEMILPAWRPGRYELAPFAENIQQYSVKDQNNIPLNWQKTAPNVWSNETADAKEITIFYQYYANKMDAGNSVINDEMIYINFINCVMYSTNHSDQSFEVKIDLPDHYQHICSLKGNTKNTLSAASYQHLVDAPILACASLNKIHYQVDKTQFTIAIAGDCPMSNEELTAGFEKFTSSQMMAMGGFPTEQYTFIVLSLDYQHYHGVEHQDNTVLVLGPNDAASKADYQEKLMGVASHELFHAWNVTRIRPAEMCPYQFRNETITESGFVTEGFTTYFGDLFLAHSGYFSQTEYFKELNVLLKRHFENYGRLESTLIASSRNLWVDGYKSLFPSKKVSIYVKGALCALILDLTIRRLTEHKKTLIDVLKTLMTRHTVQQGGYHKVDVYRIIEEVGTVQIRPLIVQLYESTDDLYPILTTAFKSVGCVLVENPHLNILTSQFGIQVVGEQISAIAPSAVAARFLSVGDTIELVNGEALNNQITAFPDPTEFRIKRGGKTKIISVRKSQSQYYTSHKVECFNSRSEAQEKNLQRWLGNN